MDDRIKVHVVRYSGRPNLLMRYVDPDTGRQIARTTKTSNQRDAERAAAKWEAELREGRYNKPSRMTWQGFREQYDRESLDGLKASTATCYSSTLNVFEKLMRPGKLSELTTPKLTAFVVALRNERRKPATIARHLRALKVAARWAQRQGLLLKLPSFDMPKYAKGMKHRAVTGEEIDRLVDAAPKVMGEVAGPSWEFLLRGLEASGLRLGESLVLRWDDAPGAIVVDLSGRRPMLRVPAESEKGGTHRLLPLAPEAATLLLTVPKSDRTGYVFRPLAKTGEPVARTRWAVGDRIEAIAKHAGVVVGQREKIVNGKPVVVNEYASAHDFRRAFGVRWARKVMPTVLREIMRHSDISTTLAYYVGADAEATADALWATCGQDAARLTNSIRPSARSHEAMSPNHQPPGK